MHRPSFCFVCRSMVLGVIAAVAVGCGGGYAIQGRVVRGPVAEVQLVGKNDPRLTEPDGSGGGAVVQAVLEPQTPSEIKDLGRHVTDGQGRFAIPVDAVGAGLFEYEAQLVARRDGHRGAMALIPLPRGGQRVLITLPVGHDTLVVPERLIDRVRRDAEPYLDKN
ncbi:MAG: hypothetical protein ACE37H_02055 [Phycisphaeraceae bacterium]